MQFGGGCHLWGRDCPFLALTVACLPLCLRWGMGHPQPASSPLVFAQSFFCEQSWQCLRLELLTGKGSLSFFSSLAISWFGLLSPVSSLRLSSGHSGPVLTLSSAACTSLSSPLLLVADVSSWATSPLGVVVRRVICGFYLFIFSSQLCCPLRFQNSPQTRR